MRSLVLALAVAAWCPLAHAAPDAPVGTQGNEAMRQYCAGDYLNFCGTLAQNDPGLNMCFKSNRARLSENCRRSIEFYYAEQGKKW